MAFQAYSFVFDGIPCEEYGLMIYDFDGNSQGNGAFGSNVTIKEDRIARRGRSLHYGAVQNSPLEFTLVFGADINSMKKDVHLDRWDLEVIGSWLTGHDQYKWLEVHQNDLETLRYRCIITDLKFITLGWLPWALSCKVICDSPFAYTYPEEFTFNSEGTGHGFIQSRSTFNGFYYPPMKIHLPQGGDFTIINHSDKSRECSFTSMTAATELAVSVDNENGIIKASSGLNLYPYFNFQFFRLIRGDNTLEFAGKGSVTFTCEFPVNVGG